MCRGFRGLVWTLSLALAVTVCGLAAENIAGGDKTKPAQRGTEQAPVVVEVLPIRKTDSEMEQDKADRREREQIESKKSELDGKLVDFNRDLARYTLVLAVVGVLQLLLLVLQAVFVPLGFKESRRAGDTARQAMIVSNRAYVHYDGCNWISHRDLTIERVYWVIHVKWLNGGNTPTRALRVYVGWLLRDQPLPVDFVPPEPPLDSPPATISPKGSILQPFSVFGSDLAAVRNGTKHLYFWGVALYRDVFLDTPQRMTRFCVRAGDITGNPEAEWNETNNRVGIIFSHYGPGNCTDEECAVA